MNIARNRFFFFNATNHRCSQTQINSTMIFFLGFKLKRILYVEINTTFALPTGRSVPSVGGRVVAEQPEAGGLQQRSGSVAVRRGRREKGQVSHQALRARGEHSHFPG